MCDLEAFQGLIDDITFSSAFGSHGLRSEPALRCPNLQPSLERLFEFRDVRALQGSLRARRSKLKL